VCLWPSSSALPLTRSADNTKGSNAVKYITLAVYVVLSLVAMRYLRAKQLAVREPVVYERRKRRQAGKPDPSASELEEGAGQAPLYAPKALRAAPEPAVYSLSGMPTPAMTAPTMPEPAVSAPTDNLRRSGDELRPAHAESLASRR
jgi:hypothetical protein